MGAQKVNFLEYAGCGKRELLKQGWFRSLTLALTSTLSMATMGSAVLPLAYIFASTGIVVGFVTALIIASVNVYTSRLLIRQAGVTGAWDYESLGNLVKGYWWQKFVEFSNWILLFGTMVGSIAQLGEGGTHAIRMLWCNGPPAWLMGPILPDGTEVGAFLMVMYVVILVAPWSLASGIKELEFVGFLGYPIVLWMTFSIVGRCIQQGFPAITDGSLPIVGFTGLSSIAAAISTWAFAFYIQPVIFPFYSELPPGNVGQHATSIAVDTVLMVTAPIPYLLIGFFGAALWGPAAAETGNVLQNDIYGEFVDGEASCPSPKQGALNICMTVYLAMTLAGIEYALDHTVNTWVDQIREIKCMRWIPVRGKGKAGRFRDVVVSWSNLALSTGVALVFHDSSTALTVTGATGVLLVSFVIPIVNHYILLFNKADCQRDPELISKVRVQRGSFLHVDSPTDAELAQTSRGTLASFRDSFGAQPDFSPVKSVDSPTDVQMRLDSESTETPLINAYYAPQFASPMSYRKVEGSGTLKFWLCDIVIPALVLVFGIFASICTLIGVVEEYSAVGAGEGEH